MTKSQFLLQIFLYYFLLTAVVYFISDFVIFPNFQSSYDDKTFKPAIIKLTTDDNKKISAVYLPHPNARFTVLISHGNAEDLGNISFMIKDFFDHGFSVFAYDYHGYGTSEGRPSEKNTYLDIEAAFHYLVTTLRIPPNHIILYGRSLGSGPTLELARQTKVAGIILESAFTTAFRVMTVLPLFPVDKYRNLQKIEGIETPILFIHGTKDTVIPLWHSEKLYEKAPPKKSFLRVLGAGHNDVMEKGYKQYWQAIQEFVLSLND